YRVARPVNASARNNGATAARRPSQPAPYLASRHAPPRSPRLRVRIAAAIPPQLRPNPVPEQSPAPPRENRGCRSDAHFARRWPRWPLAEPLPGGGDDDVAGGVQAEGCGVHADVVV